MSTYDFDFQRYVARRKGAREAQVREGAAYAFPGDVRLPVGALAPAKTFAIAEWEARKLLHDPTDILVRTVQPALWLLIFGVTFTRIRAIPTGNQSYLQFLAPGILAQSVLFAAIFYGVAVVWERDLGIVHKLLVSPASRASW